MKAATVLALAGVVLILLFALGLRIAPPADAQNRDGNGRGGPRLTHGATAGDVGARSAVLWARADGPATVTFELSLDPAFDGARRIPVSVQEGTDFVAKAVVEGLQPNALYEYRVWAEREGQRSDPIQGRFRTAPQSDAGEAITLLWSADLGGQGRCRRPEYEIFRAMAAVPADLFLLLGDSIYADGVCPSPPNEPGSEFNAAFLKTLEAYRAKHRYNRADPPFLALLARTPVVAVWDDHEVMNDFVGTEVDPELLRLGRQALREYYPIHEEPDDPHRLYRAFRWGKHLELLVLDTRQYRVPGETMLGGEQLRWLLERIERSDATWLAIASSVTLSVARGCPRCDGWADGLPGEPTGYERELAQIAERLEALGRRNVVFLTGDVHHPRALSYDPDGDGDRDFLEFTAGPLSASARLSSLPDPTFRPRTLYIDGGFFNFGVLRVSEEGVLTVEFRDATGRARFQRAFEPVE